MLSHLKVLLKIFPAKNWKVNYIGHCWQTSAIDCRANPPRGHKTSLKLYTRGFFSGKNVLCGRCRDLQWQCFFIQTESDGTNLSLDAFLWLIIILWIYTHKKPGVCMWYGRVKQYARAEKHMSGRQHVISEMWWSNVLHRQQKCKPHFKLFFLRANTLNKPD